VLFDQEAERIEAHIALVAARCTWLRNRIRQAKEQVCSIAPHTPVYRAHHQHQLHSFVPGLIFHTELVAVEATSQI